MPFIDVSQTQNQNPVQDQQSQVQQPQNQQLQDGQYSPAAGTTLADLEPAPLNSSPNPGPINPSAVQSSNQPNEVKIASGDKSLPPLNTVNSMIASKTDLSELTTVIKPGPKTKNEPINAEDIAKINGQNAVEAGRRLSADPSLPDIPVSELNSLEVDETDRPSVGNLAEIKINSDGTKEINGPVQTNSKVEATTSSLGDLPDLPAINEVSMQATMPTESIISPEARNTLDEKSSMVKPENSNEYLASNDALAANKIHSTAVSGTEKLPDLVVVSSPTAQQPMNTQNNANAGESSGPVVSAAQGISIDGVSSNLNGLPVQNKGNELINNNGLPSLPGAAGKQLNVMNGNTQKDVNVVPTSVGNGLMTIDSSMEDIMAKARALGASDIHFTAEYPIMIRVNGSLQALTDKINSEQATNYAESLLDSERLKIYKAEKEVDFSYTNANNDRFRVNLFTQKGYPAGAIRLISAKIKTITELQLPEVLYDIISEPYGLVLVVGPTGSGKSTTLAGMINHINENRADHIVTIEDPIEYIYPQGKSIVNQRELNADTLSWQRALKSVLREDPNVVLVGEMRDIETIEATVTVAETGHLTFATLHTNSAAQAIDRIIDVFPEGSKSQIRAQLANVLVAVISQRLLPVASGGRKAALEIMIGTVAVKNAIREGKTHQLDNIIQTSGDSGMITLEKSLIRLIEAGEITQTQAMAYTSKPEELESLLSKKL